MLAKTETGKTQELETMYNFVGLWRNQHGSEMNITSAENGRISGSFKTGVGAFDSEEEHALVGCTSGTLISFCVNFEKYNSLTAWAGQHTSPNGEDKIETMWHLARTLPDASDDLWAGIWTGSDTFHRVEFGLARILGDFDRPPFIPSYPFQVSKK